VTLTIDYIVVMGESDGGDSQFDRVYDAAAFESGLTQRYAEALGIPTADVRVTSMTPKLDGNGKVTTVETITDVGPDGITFSTLESAVEAMAGSAATSNLSEHNESS
jgi:hypothetical protein